MAQNDKFLHGIRCGTWNADTVNIIALPGELNSIREVIMEIFTQHPITGNGKKDTPIAVEVSAKADNLLTKEEDGLYVKAPEASQSSGSPQVGSPDNLDGYATYGLVDNIVRYVKTTGKRDGSDDAQASGNLSIASGVNAQASGTGSSAYGNAAQALNTRSLAIGETSVADSPSSTAVGGHSKANASKASAFGYLAQAGFRNSVALGAGSISKRENSVSVGNLEGQLTRQITDAAPGTQDNDVVTLGQLKAALGSMFNVAVDDAGNLTLTAKA